MYLNDSSSWRTDVKWLSAILLALALMAAVPLFSFSQLSSRERAVPILERVLELTLTPTGEEGVVAAVREDIGYTPGGRLELLPGSGMFVESEELPELDAQGARERIAQALAAQVLAEGAGAAAARLAGTEVERQFSAALEGTAADLVRATLVAQMLSEGLDNGSRLANWPLQAQRNPGEPVQPVVGVFVRLPPAELEEMSARQIGEAVVVAVADTMLADGLEAARELVSNPNLRQQLTSAAQGPIPGRLQELFETVLLAGEEALAERIDLASEALQASTEGSEQGAGALETGVATREELAGLTAEQANALVLGRLAEIAYSNGSGALLQSITEVELTGRITPVAGLVDALSRRAHGEYVRLTWLVAGITLLLLVALVVFSSGWGRLANPGLALALPSAAMALIAIRLSELVTAPAALPTSLRAQGAVGYLVQLFTYVTSSLPQGAASLLVRNQLVVLSIGAGLVILSLLIRLLRRLRPRRRSLI